MTSMTTSSTATGLADPTLLEKIDKLFACNVGEHVDLPQLVVVGDQSSGKSSVLEALTCLPFPRESTLCTKYATKITFRRTPDTTVAASIVPSQDSSEEHQKKAREWKMSDLQQLDPTTFAAIMEEANSVMEFKTDAYGNLSQFSMDVLSLEIGGPDQEHLSIIDVPGLFQRHKEGVTTKADIELVRRLVHDYMRNPRSVMLTVIPANVDIATQGILETAEQLDPEGIRTLGVLTKPDLVDKGAEHNVVDLVTGREHQLLLGWHLLRNAGQSELGNSIESRKQAETDFFETAAPWKDLDKHRVGIDSFRVRLQEVLSDHIRREFPKVKSEVTKRLKDSKNSLDHLGAKRQTPNEQYQYLIDMSMSFQKIVADALATNYGHRELFRDYSSLRLVTTAINRAEDMATMFAKFGHTYEFGGQSSTGAEEGGDLGSNMNVDTEDETGEVEVTGAEDDPPAGEFSNRSSSRPVRQFPGRTAVDDLLPHTSAVATPQRGEIFKWLRGMFYRTRGFEIGTVNPTLLGALVGEQAHKWKDIALGYVADLIVLTHNFVNDLLQHVCPSRQVRGNVLSLLMDQLCVKYKRAIAHVEFLLNVDLKGTPSTMNHYFNDNLQKCRQNRMQSRIKAKTFDDFTHGEVIRIGDLYQHNNQSNDEHTIQDLHDILQSYYKVARKSFVDMLRKQAVDHFLLSGPDTPLTLFSPAFVAKLTPEELEEAVGEDPMSNASGPVSRRP